MVHQNHEVEKSRQALRFRRQESQRGYGGISPHRFEVEKHYFKIVFKNSLSDNATKNRIKLISMVSISIIIGSLY
jgi:hypothetical protein